jgi:GDP-4-dehydro-6-deoxy-D-mannose reductase
VVRPFNLVGPGQSDAYVWGNIVRQVARIEGGRQEEISLANLTSRRDFMDVRDLASACWSLANLPDFRDRCAGRAFNMGSGRNHSVVEILEMVRKITGRPFPVLLLTATCGWKPALPLIQSLKDMLAYERDRPR